MTTRDAPGEADRERETLEDELLAIRCQLGEPAAFDALIERWHGPLWKYARRLTGDDEAAAGDGAGGLAADSEGRGPPA